MPRTDTWEYIFENDSVKILYSFKGLQCPVSIQIYNKLSQPLYVDWSKSAAIIDGEKVSYWADEASLSASTSGYTYKTSHNTSITNSDINGTIYKNDRISFIPPQSYIINKPVWLSHSFFEIRENQNKRSSNMKTSTNTYKVSEYLFNENSTPFKFRSFLTYSFKEDISSPLYLEDSFWVSNLIQTSVTPEALVYKPSNQYYLQKSTGIGTFMGITLVLGLLIGGAALNPVE